jgi:hypothetical protein
MYDSVENNKTAFRDANSSKYKNFCSKLMENREKKL